MRSVLRLQVWVLTGIVLVNFVAQVPWFLLNYYTPQRPWPTLRSSVTMGAVLALFIVGTVLFIRRRQTGYFLMAVFLAGQFLFYLWNTVGGAVHGFGWFYHLADPDPRRRAIFAAGYLAFLASGYYLGLLLLKRRELLESAA